MTEYRDIEGSDLSAEEALALPVGAKFSISFPEGTEVNVLRQGTDEWQAWKPLPSISQTRSVVRTDSGRFDPRTPGYSTEPTLHDAIRSALGPFGRTE